MPSVGSINVVLFFDPLPLEHDQAVELLTRPGQSAVGVLFHAPRNNPIQLTTLATAANEVAAKTWADQAAAIRRQVVTVNDGSITRQAVVIRVESMARNAGLTVGGLAPSDTWEILTRWSLLVDATWDGSQAGAP